MIKIMIAAAAVPAAGKGGKRMKKARFIVLTDIGPWDGEPDDAQSLVRLMLYTNEYDIEGIIPNASWCNPDTSDEGFVARIQDVVRAYGKVRENLLVHADGYPTEEYLMSVVKPGTTHVDRKRNPLVLCSASREEKLATIECLKGENDFPANIGDGCSNEGARLIREAIEKDDERPLWIALWGGCGTLAQALYDMSQDYSEEQMEQYCRKLRVYDIDGQDDCGGWICHNFKIGEWMRSDISFWGFSETPMKSTAQFGEECFVGNLDTVSPEWVKKNIQGVGELGKWYPSAKYGLETDSPSFLRLVQNGLNDYEHHHYGGWGGRHTLVASQNPPAVHFTGTYLYEEKPFYMYRDDVDTWYDSYNGRRMHKNILAPVARWRDDYQADMAARMQWSVHDTYAECNHNPVVCLNGDWSKDAVIRNAACGDVVRPDVSGTYDPDGDALSYRWYVYPEEGTYCGEVIIEGADTSAPIIRVPKDAYREEIHVILEVADQHEEYPLKSYRRFIIKTGETGLEGRQTWLNDTDFTYSDGWEYKTEQYGSHEGDIHISNIPGASAKLTFIGSRLMLYGGVYEDNGIARVTIDGAEMRQVDFYSNIKRWENQYEFHGARVSTGDTLQYISPYLGEGEHRLEIVVTGEKQELSKGTYVVLDRVVVFE